MTAVQPFSFADREVRVVLDDAGDPWFVAADVAKILGYSAAKDMTRRLDEDDKGGRSLPTLGGEQEHTIISEPGLYVAVLGSQVERARDFKRWVTREVLPSIRRTGSYSVAQPASPAELTRLQILDIAREAEVGRLEAERALAASRERVAELEPDAAVARNLMAANGDFSLREAAQILKRDHGIDVGQNRLMKHLVEIGWVDSNGRPYQAQVERYRLAMRVLTYDHPHTGQAMATVQVRVTPKGVRWLHEHWPQPVAAVQLSVIEGGAS